MTTVKQCDVTKRGRLAATSRATRERYRLLVETMLQGVVQHDSEGKIIAMNPSAERLLGWSRERFLGNSSVGVERQTLRENGEVFPGLEHPVMVALRSGQPVRGVVMGVFNPKLSTHVWIRVDAVPVYRPGQQRPAEAYAVFEDITEHRRTEQALLLSQARLELVQQAGRFGSFERDLRTGESRWSAELEALYGLAPGGFGGTYAAWQERIYPADRPMIKEHLARAVAQCSSFQCEFRVVWPDGTIHWLAASGKVVADEHGRPARTLGICHDITERKLADHIIRDSRDKLERQVQERTAEFRQAVVQLRAEAANRKLAETALRESEARYRTLFDSAPVGIVLSEEDGRVLAVNARTELLFGTRLGEAVGIRSLDFYAKPAARRRLLALVRAQGQVRDHELLMKRKDGSIFVALINMDRLELGGRRVLLSTCRDITQRKQTEHTLQGTKGLLSLFLTQSSRPAYLRSVVRLLRDYCQCDAVGIRMSDAQGHLPFAASVGFQHPFRDREVASCLTTHECGCVRALNDSARLAEADQDPLRAFVCSSTSRFVNPVGAPAHVCQALSCTRAGFQSIAIVSIIHQGRVFGAIHLADAQPGKFPAETVAFAEAAAPLIGEALLRFWTKESLAESEKRFRSLFENHHVVMLLTAPKTGAIMDANPAAAAFYGRSRAELCTLCLSDLNLPLSPPRLGKAQAGGARTDPVEVASRLPDGTAHHLSVHVSPVCIRRRPFHFVIVHDVTEQKRMERQILDITESEQRRLGRDLHDALGQHLTATAFLAKAAATKLARQSRPEALEVDKVVAAVNHGIVVARNISQGLCPLDLARGGLVHALNHYVAMIKDVYGLPCHLRIGPGVSVTNETVVGHCYRIVQEAVNNAIRHGRARRVEIRLAARGANLALTVRDNGQGLPLNYAAGDGMGLQTMRFRANAIGGRFAVTSKPGKGTLVSCLFPQKSVPASPA